MATKQHVGRGPRPAGAPDVRTEMLQAALDCLRENGYAGTSTREIARRGGFNSSLVFYYFGSLHGLLLAALDWNSERRRERYSELLQDIEDPADFARVALRIYREDLEGGHITVFTEMAAAALNHPDLGTELAARTTPWIDLMDQALRRLLKGSQVEHLVSSRELATATIALYMGVNLLTRFDPDGTHVDRVFALAERMTSLLTSLVAERNGV